MKRFDAIVNDWDNSGSPYVEYDYNENGECVEYEEAKKLEDRIKELEGQVEELEGQVEELFFDLEELEG